MKAQVIKYDLLLLLTAIIWGFAFVAQRVGMEFVGPFTFNAIRFGLGAMVLAPLILFNDKRARDQQAKQRRTIESKLPKLDTSSILLKGGVAIGLLLFLGSSFQQAGLVYTTAGNAGFITGLYVVIVPMMGLIWKQKIGVLNWVAVGLAILGLYLLSVKQGFTFSPGDGLVLVGAFVWAGHVQAVGWYSPKADPIKLAFIQFVTCSVLSLFVAILFEPNALQQIFKATIPLLYGGIMSAGIAFTIQVVAQRHAPPSHASIIMSLESVFAAIGGWWILHEVFTGRDLIGAGLMLSGMLLSQAGRMRGMTTE